MKSVKPIVLLSFLFFASVVAEPISNANSNDIADYDDSG